MLTLLFVTSCILSSVYMYIESAVYGLAKKRWALAAVLLGPMLLPMFQMSKRMALRKATGFDNLYLRA